MIKRAAAADWIAVDWGASRLRAWAMSGDTMLEGAQSPSGMNSLEKDDYEATLLKLIEPWLGPGRTPVFVCGMAGARDGWTEATYRKVPCAPLGDSGVTVLTRDDRIAVTLIPGLCQERPADVLRGEETQLAGFLIWNKDFDGVICLPGTHSKWVHVSAGEVVSFRSFLTGELADCLFSRSTLRQLAGPGWDENAFAEALGDTLSRPEQLAARLFSVRAEALLAGLAPHTARARISGILIGAELAAARPYWLGQAVAVVAAGGATHAYLQALSIMGINPLHADGDAMTRQGLAMARRLIGDTAA